MRLRAPYWELDAFRRRAKELPEMLPEETGTRKPGIGVIYNVYRNPMEGSK